MVLKHYYDIGVAVGAAEGLVVPVLRDADRMSFAEIEAADPRVRQEGGRRHALARRPARAAPSPSPTAACSARCMSTPILNPPQVGILGLHAIKDRPIAHRTARS